MPTENYKPKVPPGKKLIFLSPEYAARIEELMGIPRVEMDSTQFEEIEKAGRRYYRLRPETESTPGPRGGSSTGIKPWKPTFSKEGEINKVRFHPGTLNGLIATNWDTLFTIGATDTKFITLTATGEADQGKITGFSLSLASSPPSEDNPTEGVLPASFELVLGVIKDLKAQMIIDYNLNAQGSDVFTKSIVAPVAGGEAFVRFWRWVVTQDATESGGGYGL